MTDPQEFRPSPPATAVIVGEPFPGHSPDAIIVKPGDGRIRWDRHGQPYLADDNTRRAEAELATAELKALKALAGYKFLMFGYHAAQWVLAARVLGGRRVNPFRFLVHEARRALEARGAATLGEITQEPTT